MDSRKLTALITSKVKDPAGWLLALREIIELAGADVSGICGLGGMDDFGIQVWSTLKNLSGNFNAAEIGVAANKWAEGR